MQSPYIARMSAAVPGLAVQMLLVFVGAGAGGVLRLLVGRGVDGLTHGGPASVGFPWGTLAVNLVGAGLIGVVAAVILQWAGAGRTLLGPAPGTAQLLLATGVLGGFTTFSSLAIEAVGLVQSGRPVAAGLYVLMTNVLGIALAFAGFAAARGITGLMVRA